MNVIYEGRNRKLTEIGKRWGLLEIYIYSEILRLQGVRLLPGKSGQRGSDSGEVNRPG